MIINALKNPVSGMVISFMFGIALVMVMAPICRGRNCIIVKAPPIHEIKDSVYQIGTKCYKFDTVALDCPASGVVESFENLR
jgi:hypothetical protein